MSKPILVANWKNHPASPEEASSILKGLGKKSAIYKKLFTFIAPPSAYFESVSKRAKSFSSLATQDIFPLDGTHTGALTVDILKNLGVKLAIIGHSERRALGETSADVSAKVKTVLRAGIIPLVCVGEAERDHEGNYFEFISEELKHSLSSVANRKEAEKLIIAYEPIWAIGAKATGVVEPADLSQMIIFIKKVLTGMFDRKTAEKIPILYGGSVDASNASALSRQTGSRGFLVGRASLDPKKFSAIAEALIK
jgi:triosephosphate isomerase